MPQAVSCEHTGKFFYHSCPDDPAQAGPGVHALVIGTSCYTAAKGEAKPVFGDIAGTAVAAGRFATWLTEEFHDPRSIPLRTVRLLLSPVNSERHYLPEGYIPEETTFDNVATALQRWRNDCNSYSGNVAILYLGGHGTVTTGGAQHVFLSEANVFDDRYLKSIYVSGIRDIMADCRARSNIYILDCCAVPPGAIPPFTGKGGMVISAFGEDNDGAKKSIRFHHYCATRDRSLTRLAAKTARCSPGHLCECCRRRAS